MSDFLPDDEYMLLPDVVFIPIQPDIAQLAFSNHSVTFNGMPIVTALESAIDALRAPLSLSCFVKNMHERTGASEQLSEMLIDLLLNAKCILRRKGGVKTNPSFADQLNLRSDHTNEGSDTAPILFCPNDKKDFFSDLFSQCDVQGPIIGFEYGKQPRDVRSVVEQVISENVKQLVLVWGFPYRASLPRIVNELSLQNGFPVLYGTCDSAVGRVGPWVLPGSTSCLECLLSRFASNGGINEVVANKHYRIATERYLPLPALVHPAFGSMLASAFLQEATKVLKRIHPSTMGSLWEYDFLSPQPIKRTVLRAPRCQACKPSNAPRLPWNAVYPNLSRPGVS
ncbi:TOMM precursor leader peptide-binding protein [Rhizobium leguminosarum]|uniref:TOMM precursor leader peptide-binding protein n=1 Tax=Rhizobium leguminosarum TaxID=384 RepID=UPI003D6E83E2